MENDTQKLLADLNQAVIQFRGLYSAWSKKHGISYNEMLVLYTIRDNGFCTQKQICDSYLLPRQTMNHVITDMRKRGLLTISPKQGSGREKAFVLTRKGQTYAAPLLDSLNKIEAQAIESAGCGTIRSLSESLMDFDSILKQSMEENA
ncbi:MAG: MarR family transcriptional regulator [Lachnospiraceae bacterium]|nr:MarR family transcriptional regulator [Lachnospiraceae bacterium]